MVFKFNTAKAVSYANNYANKSNPFYKTFLDGEDCNFVSQCLLAGSENVSDKKEWFYVDEKNYSSSWVDQNDLFEYLISAQKGPFGRVVNGNNVMVGDIVFVSDGEQKEVGIVTKIIGNETFFVVKNKIFEEKNIDKYACFHTKFLHILGVKK